MSAKRGFYIESFLAGLVWGTVIGSVWRGNYTTAAIYGVCASILTYFAADLYRTWQQEIADD